MDLADLSVTASSNTVLNSAEGVTTIADTNNIGRHLMALVRRFAASNTIAAATTTDLASKDELFLTTTGTATTITGFGTIAAGIWKVVVLNAAHTLTYNATSLKLPTSASITGAAGDAFIAVSEGSGNWNVIFYQRKDGTAIAATSYPTLAGDNTWTGTQIFRDNKLQITDDADTSKVAAFQASGITTATTRTYTLPDASGTLKLDSMATSKVLGRSTAGTGAIEELTLSAVLDLVGSAAQGDVLYRGASGWTRLGAGTSGYYLKTQGAGADPVWATAAGAWTLVSTTTVTAVASIDFDLQEDVYGSWVFVVDGVAPATDGSKLLMRPGYSAGTVFDSANAKGVVLNLWGTPAWAAISDYIVIGDSTNGVGKAANEQGHAVITIGGLGATLLGGLVYESKCTFINTTNNQTSSIINAGYGSENGRVFDSVRFLWSSGNFAAQGTIKMFALKRAG